MRAALNALTEELRRLKAAGVRTISVTDEGLAALRRAAAGGAGGRPAGSGAPPPANGDSAAAVPAPGLSVAAIPPPPTVRLGEGDKVVRLAALRAQVLADPVCCAHVRPGKKVVFGVGNPDARILFVGEAPGAEEEVQGEPFVGPAGQLLNRMIAATGLSRGEVYIGNILNWRPEIPGSEGAVQFGNRPPTPEEMAYCLPYLRAQIAVVAPTVVVALGATAAHGLLGHGSFRALHEIRGTWREFDGKPLMVTYHPSFILRNPTNKSKRLIWVDLIKVMEHLSLPISDKQRGYFLEKAV